MVHRADITLNGNELSLEDIVAIGTGEKKVRLDEEALQRCRESRSFLKGELDAGRIIYGVNTSFGPMCKNIIHRDEIDRLQLNLVRSHAAGLGEPLSPSLALAVLAVRLNSLIKGYSGVSIELLEHIKEMINLGIAPYIPECGSVGASGDLVHLAHAALSIIGEGRVFHKGELKAARQVFEESNLSPYRLSFKEGLALTNGTSAMTAIAAFALIGAKKLLRAACVSAAFGVEIFGGIDDAFDPDLHEVKPHPGQIKIASIIRSLCRGSENLTMRKDLHDRIRKPDQGDAVSETSISVQDVYSIRCTPQILAPAVEAIESAARVVELEANSCNDNPVIFPSKKKIIHGGNFHGESVAVAADTLAIALSKLTTLSEP
jgi:histidine ammonia-lyase